MSKTIINQIKTHYIAQEKIVKAKPTKLILKDGPWINLLTELVQCAIVWD